MRKTRRPLAGRRSQQQRMRRAGAAAELDEMALMHRSTGRAGRQNGGSRTGWWRQRRKARLADDDERGVIGRTVVDDD